MKDPRPARCGRASFCISVLCLVTAAGALVTAAGAQGATTVPPGYADSRGNDALSMPLRWHQGMLQVLMRHDPTGKRESVVPKSMVAAQLKEVVLRKPGFLGEPAYPALIRTFTLQLASTDLPVKDLVQDMGANRTKVTSVNGASPLTAVVSATQFNIPASLAPGYTSAVGPDLLRVPFAVPFAFKGPDLFVDWQTTSTSTQPDPHGWVDALVFAFGGDSGVAVTLGQGGCSSLTPPVGLPMTLEADGEIPASSTTFSMRLRNAHPDAAAMLWVGPKLLTPKKSTGPYPVYPPLVTFLRTFTRAGCHFWTEPMAAVFGKTSPVGGLDFGVAVPSLAAVDMGARFVFQGAVEPNTGPVELTNGMAVFAGSARVGDDAGMVLAPQAFVLNSQNQQVPPTSPWPVYAHSMPILRFAW